MSREKDGAIVLVPLYDLPQLSDMRRQEYTEEQQEGREAHAPPDPQQGYLPGIR